MRQKDHLLILSQTKSQVQRIEGFPRPRVLKSHVPADMSGPHSQHTWAMFQIQRAQRYFGYFHSLHFSLAFLILLSKNIHGHFILPQTSASYIAHYQSSKTSSVNCVKCKASRPGAWRRRSAPSARQGALCGTEPQGREADSNRFNEFNMPDLY